MGRQLGFKSSGQFEVAAACCPTSSCVSVVASPLQRAVSVAQGQRTHLDDVETSTFLLVANNHSTERAIDEGLELAASNAQSGWAGGGEQRAAERAADWLAIRG